MSVSQDAPYISLADRSFSFLHTAAPAAAQARDFAASDLGRLALLSAVIKEALRLCTPAPYGGARHVVNQEGATLCGYHVPTVGGV